MIKNQESTELETAPPRVFCNQLLQVHNGPNAAYIQKR